MSPIEEEFADQRKAYLSEHGYDVSTAKHASASLADAMLRKMLAAVHDEVKVRTERKRKHKEVDDLMQTAIQLHSPRSKD